MDSQTNDRFTAISGKLDIVLRRQQEQEVREHNIMARLAHLEAKTQTRADHRHMKLGKKESKRDPRTLRLARYLLDPPPPPSIVDWTSGISSYGLMLNDQLGDCTIAGCGHAVQGWTAACGQELTLPDWAILDYYRTWDGYIPGDPSTDQGGVEVDVLNNWRKYGFGYRTQHQGAEQLLAYCDPSPGNLEHIKQSIALFGGCYIGLALPISAQQQDVWDVVGDGLTGNSAPGSWGGHCVWVLKYTPTRFTFVTWGALKDMTIAFWNAYCDEAHTLLSPLFLKNGKTPAGLDLATLLADQALVVG